MITKLNSLSISLSVLDWARESEEKEQKLEDVYKKEVEHKYENGKKFKITNIFKVERIQLPRSIAERKVRVKERERNE